MKIEIGNTYLFPSTGSFEVTVVDRCYLNNEFDQVLLKTYTEFYDPKYQSYISYFKINVRKSCNEVEQHGWTLIDNPKTRDDSKFIIYKDIKR